MAARFVSKKNIDFLLYDVFDVERLTAYDYYKEHSRKVFDMVIEAAVKLAGDLMWPVLEEMDLDQPELVDGQVKVHPRVKEILKECGEGGWISSSFPVEHGGRFGLSLKRAGYDGIMVRGKSDAPVYLKIENQEISIRDAQAVRFNVAESECITKKR